MTKQKLAKPRKWEEMLLEKGARERIERENPDGAKFLDYLASRRRPFDDGTGWTTFNDWLDDCYRTGLAAKCHEGIPYFPVDKVRMLTFPACRR